MLHQGASYRFRVVDAIPPMPLPAYFGRAMVFAIARPLAVKRGDIIALSVPTWAPVLAVGLDANTVWRASRARGACTDLFTPTAQTDKRALAKYQCLYRTARLTYGATVAGDPPAAAPLTSPS